MKALRWLFLGMLVTGCATVPLLAATVNLQWTNADDYDAVKVYDGTTVIATVPGPMASNSTGRATVTVKPGAKSLTVRGVTGGLESEPSNTVSTNCHPNAPVNLR
jgi:hypothetical protein